MRSSNQASQFGIAFRYLSFESFIEPKLENSAELGHAAIYFPIAGFAFGVGFMASYFLISHIVGPQWSSLTVILIMIWVFNGRMYGDCIKILAVSNMKPGLERDIFRGLLIFTLFMLRFLALTHMGKGWVLQMLILTPTLSCWSLVYLTHSISTNISNSENGIGYACFVKAREFWGATLFATLTAGILMEIEGLFLLMFISVWTGVYERLVLNKTKLPLKYLFGALMELNEIFILLGAIVLRKGLLISVANGIWV